MSIKSCIFNLDGLFKAVKIVVILSKTLNQIFCWEKSPLIIDIIQWVTERKDTIPKPSPPSMWAWRITLGTQQTPVTRLLDVSIPQYPQDPLEKAIILRHTMGVLFGWRGPFSITIEQFVGTRKTAGIIDQPSTGVCCLLIGRSFFSPSEMGRFMSF